MAKKIFKTSVRPGSMKVVLLVVALMILINILARFGLLPIEVTSTYSNLITLGAAIFLLSEVAAVQMFTGRKKLGLLNVFITIVAILSILGVVLSFVGMTVAALTNIQGIVEIALLLFVLVEIFRKN